MKKSIDANAITAKMYLEQVEIAMDNIIDLMYEDLRVAEAKGDNEEVVFIKDNISKIENNKIRVDSIGDDMSNLVGLSWEIYKGNIYKKKKGE